MYDIKFRSLNETINMSIFILNLYRPQCENFLAVFMMILAVYWQFSTKNLPHLIGFNNYAKKKKHINIKTIGGTIIGAAK